MRQCAIEDQVTLHLLQGPRDEGYNPHRLSCPFLHLGLKNGDIKEQIQYVSEDSSPAHVMGSTAATMSAEHPAQDTKRHGAFSEQSHWDTTIKGQRCTER